MSKKVFPALFLCVFALALGVRTARLDLRPMHHDEANQAYKFGDLLDRGEYRYDPEEHHGPSLYYLTLPVATAAGVASYAYLDETVLRLVPAIFGTGVLVLLLFLRGGLSDKTLVFSGLALALSPVMSFYGRFYIQETLLVFFLAGLIAAGWRFVQTGSFGPAAAAGLAAGLMFATKETSLILFGSAAAALVLTGIASLFYPKNGLGADAPARPRVGLKKMALVLLVFFGLAIAAAGLLFSSFLKYPAGIRDSLLAFGTYFERAGSAGAHTHPWSYYLQTLTWSRFGNGPVWSEAFLLILAVGGGVSAWVRRPGTEDRRESGNFLRFMFFFTVAAAAVYSLIPYKTPWNMLPFVFGMTVLAGAGAAALWGARRTPRTKIIIPAVLVLGFATLGYQSYRANFVDYANPSNPYVYAQTGLDYQKLVAAVDGVAKISPEGRDLLVKVVAPPSETWPLPWSLRKYGRVGYWTDLDEAGDLSDAPLVISSAAFADEIDSRLGDGYQSAFFGLRPEVVLTLYVRRDLWDEYLKKRSGRNPGD